MINRRVRATVHINGKRSEIFEMYSTKKRTKNLRTLRVQKPRSSANKFVVICRLYNTDS